MRTRNPAPGLGLCHDPTRYGPGPVTAFWGTRRLSRPVTVSESDHGHDGHRRCGTPTGTEAGTAAPGPLFRRWTQSESDSTRDSDTAAVTVPVTPSRWDSESDRVTQPTRGPAARSGRRAGPRARRRNTITIVRLRHESLVRRSRAPAGGECPSDRQRLRLRRLLRRRVRPRPRPASESPAGSRSSLSPARFPAGP